MQEEEQRRREKRGLEEEGSLEERPEGAAMSLVGSQIVSLRRLEAFLPKLKFVLILEEGGGQ